MNGESLMRGHGKPPSSNVKRWVQVGALLAAMAVASACKKGTIVHGRVVDAKTGQPVAGATVTVRFAYLDANNNWLDGGQATLTSGPGGEFATEHSDMRARFTAVAQREGYYPNHDSRPARQLTRHPAAMEWSVDLALCPVESPQPLPRGQGEVRFYPPGRRMGWSFAAQQLVPEHAADFVGELDEAQREIAILAARGRGGLVQTAGLNAEWALFNMPVAPRNGYRERIDLREVRRGEDACYFVRTADGAHYAKIVVVGPIRSREYQGLRFYWVYQPNGSHALEIPLEKAPD